MVYMIIEKFHANKIKEIYSRLEEKGRLMPDGLIYINSWIDEKIEICFQVMETESEDKLYEWIDNWKDLTDFEVIRVMNSADAKKKVLIN